MRFSVIIPTLNEEKNIEKQIEHIKRINPNAEIIVSDGGSTDKTIQIAEKKGVKVIKSQPGRGTQQRTGAMEAASEILLFLHADTRLPDNAFEQIERIFEDPSCLIATFRIRFYPQFTILRMVSIFSRFDTLITRFGDQCIIVRRSFYDFLGGFPEWMLFEDINLLEKARKYTRIRSIPSCVVTSSRRFQRNGVIRQLFWNAWLVLLYHLGRSPSRLAEMYRRRL